MSDTPVFTPSESGAGINDPASNGDDPLLNPDTALLARADAAIDFLSACIANAPDSSMEPRPAMRDEIESNRATWMGQRSNLQMCISRMQECQRALIPLENWRDVSKAILAELRRTEADAVSLGPDAFPARALAELRHTIQILDHGPDTTYGEEQTELLSNVFAAHGIRPVHGKFYDGKSGLQGTLVRIEAAQKALADARATLAVRVSTIEQMYTSVPSNTA